MGSHVLAGYSAGLGGPVRDVGTVQADPFVLQPLPCCDLAETDVVLPSLLEYRESYA